MRQIEAGTLTSEHGYKLIGVQEPQSIPSQDIDLMLLPLRVRAPGYQRRRHYAGACMFGEWPHFPGQWLASLGHNTMRHNLK